MIKLVLEFVAWFAALWERDMSCLKSEGLSLKLRPVVSQTLREKQTHLVNSLRGIMRKQDASLNASVVSSCVLQDFNVRREPVRITVNWIFLNASYTEVSSYKLRTLVVSWHCAAMSECVCTYKEFHSGLDISNMSFVSLCHRMMTSSTAKWTLHKTLSIQTKIHQNILVSLWAVSTVTSSGLMEINPSFTELDGRRFRVGAGFRWRFRVGVGVGGQWETSSFFFLVKTWCLHYP